MALDQRVEIPPFNANDLNAVKNFTAALKENIGDLLETAHQHNVRTTAPSVNEGNVTDIIPVSISGVPYLYIKFPAPINWARVALTQV